MMSAPAMRYPVTCVGALSRCHGTPGGSFESTGLDERGANKFASLFAEGALKIMDKNPQTNGVADGYEMIPSHLWTDREILRALDETQKDVDKGK